ncbi:putative membrane protein YwzB [Weizmannia acidilactici]|uniref:Membrane protein YwzB n=1 Tax=Weizmannia acidilactici TaxID=2607726 RepID=A0A5J4JG50_9BACI|nr:DUF1146 family protein [Weizmannia acidilactici]GER66387.1 putative membrane protein YwzB [Weizmannia acidilactici]GER69467.1 putative membrane protein YwzB [Weizmannia acidilactici]GER73004.1 putative membrane protein YwzB [Weizmannia acidilactici]
MTAGFGTQAVISIITNLFFIGMTFWILQAINIEKILKKNRVIQAKLLYIFLSVAIGYSVSNFFLDYLLWAQHLPLLFHFIFAG